MKKLFFGVTAFIVISLVFVSCPNDPGNGDPVIPINSSQKTLVVFDNTYGICTALVYDDYRRRDMDKIAEIPAGQCSDEFEYTPNVSIPFYFAYRISLKGVSGFFVDFVPAIGKDQRAVRLDAGTRTVIPIPALDEAVTSQQQVLSSKSYLTIQNNSNYSFQLHRGVSMIRPDNFPDSGVVNSGERAPYTISPGRSSDYRLLVGTDYKDFPNSPDRFLAGNFYSYRFTDTVSLDAAIPINLDNIDIKTYTVSFDGNGGSGTVASQSVRIASGITLPLGSGLTNGDEIFGGWCADSSGAGIVYSAGTTYTVTGDTTLYAKWYPAGTTLYTVTFDSTEGNEIASQNMVSGALAIRPADPYRAGYTFTGWCRDSNMNTPYDFTTPVTESFTLYATWSANRYTVTFHANGADGAAPAAVTVDYGIGITLPGAGNLSKQDEIFRGWNTEDDGTGTAYISGSPYTVTADVTLFAVWSSIPVYEMVYVQGGGFEMGRNLGTGGGNDISPVHTVTLSAFYMGKYEVTQAQYKAVMWTTLEEQQALAGTNTTNYGRGDNYPMYYVSWYDALVFCNKLSMAEGLSPAYRINNNTDPDDWGSVPTSDNATWDAVEIIGGSTGYRLPTEAQWEYAAKGGNPGSYTYAGSDNPNEAGWYSGNAGNTTHAVGTKALNELGIYDMSGNVWEWCQDWYGNYSSEAQINPVGASSGSDRVIRGGSWYHPAQFSYSVLRYNNYQYRRNNSQGFRLVRPAVCTITFNINGGTGTNPAAQTSSSTITLPNSTGFSKSGYTFGGWNTNADGTGETYSAGSSYVVTGNVTLYARWVYAITFDINGGTGTSPTVQTASSGSTVTLPGGGGFSRNGYTFGGWNTDPSGAGINYTAGSSYTGTVNITLYAKWDAVIYTVSFNINGGTGTSPATQTVNSGSTITLPNSTGFSKSGYTLVGWNTNADGTGETYNAGSSYTVTGNVTLYAKWNITYTVTFNINVGTGTTPAVQTAGSGSTVTLPGGGGFSRSGYTFGGWNTDPSGTGTNYNAGSSYTVTRDVTLYAKWNSVPAPEMVFVPGGSFEMGRNLGTGSGNDATPVHTVTLTNGFYMGKYEVTQAQYEAVMGNNPDGSDGVGYNYPVYRVSWYDAVVFCNKLSMMESLTPAYRINSSTDPVDWGSVPTSSNSTWNAVTIDSGSTGYRLPTEAQWEYAAKGGNPLATGWVGYTYAGSDTVDDVAWYYFNSGYNSKVVGTKAPNGLGLYDMSGNVDEWCWDWHGSYPSEAQTDPTGDSSGSARVRRGGGWTVASPEFVRSAYRGSYIPSNRVQGVGFRLARPYVYNAATVTFNINGGTGTTPAAQTVSSGSTITIPSEGGFSRSSYTFGGWNTNATGTGSNYSAGSSYTVTGDVTLYARWILEMEMEMVYVPGGSFQMGNPDSSVGQSNERPVHTVTLSGFYMGRTEVTQAQYQAVMGSNPVGDEGVGDNYPVYYVGWYDALVFCNKLSIAEGLTPAYRINNSTDPAAWGIPNNSNNPTWDAVTIVSDSTGYRLPTEAQWEYAAKGGNGSPGNYTYAGSNTVGDVAWYSGNSGDTIHTVGTKAPNGLGLYDMSGNMWEWCWDLYGSYSSGAQTDPMGASSGSNRVLRGGGWGNTAESARSAFRRSTLYLSGGDDDFSFRLVRPAQ